MPFSFLKIKIGTKIAIIYFILGFLSILAINLIWFLPSLDETKQNAANIQFEVAKRGASQIETFLAYKVNSLEYLTSFLNPEGDKAEQEIILEKFLQKDQAFFEVTLLDINGQEKNKVSQFQIFTAQDLKNRETEQYFMEAKQGANYISDVYFSEKAEPYLILAFPVMTAEKNIGGVLMAKLNLRQMWQVVSDMKSGSDSQAYVVDGKGNLIAHSNPSLVLQNLNLSDLGPVKYVTEKRLAVDGLGPNDGYTDKQGQKILVVGVPLKLLPWSLFIERPESAAYAGLTKKFAIFLLIAVLGGGAIILVSRWLGGYLTNPLRRLGEGAKIIGSGDLEYRLDIKTGDEIEELAGTFNEMANRLKESYMYMEKKVEERTNDLKVQRDRLDETAKKLIQRDIALGELRQKEEKSLNEAEEAKKKAEEARVATLNVLEDVQEARRAQEKEKNKVEAVIRSLTDGLILLDEVGKIFLINSQAEAMLNLKKGTFLGENINEISQAAIKKISEVLKKSAGDIDKEEIIFEVEKEKIFEMSTAQVAGTDKKVIGKIIILHDITREKAIERMKSEFVTIAAHQLRTPLSAVKWTMRLILDRDMGPISKEQEEILLKGYQSNERMINLINDLLNVARIEEGRFNYTFSEVAFADLLNESLDVYQPLIKVKKLKIAMEKPECVLPKMKLDKEKIKLVLQNLIENAINYSPAGGEVTISYKCDKMNLTFSVKDRGMGIPEKQHSRIFSKFFRAENAVRMETEGTGLGLFIVKNIIESHNGKVWFESKESKGTTFYFTIPLG